MLSLHNLMRRLGAHMAAITMLPERTVSAAAPLLYSSPSY